jgi:hypothetical protein
MIAKKLRLILTAALTIALVCSSLPASAFAADVVKEVKNESEFKAALKDASVTYIRLTADIELKKNDATYTINPKKPSLVIDGTDSRGVRHTLSEHPDNTAIGLAIVAVRSGSAAIKSITVQNIDVVGSQEYGIVHIYDCAKNDITLTFDNVDYRGPALTVAYGSSSKNKVIVRNTNILLDPALSKYNRASEAVSSWYTEIQGTVNIDRYGSSFNEDYDEIFLLLYKNSKLVVAENAVLNVNNYANPIDHKSKSAYSYSGLVGTWWPSCDTSSVELMRGARVTYNGIGPVVDDLVREDSSLANLDKFTIGESASFRINTAASGIGKKFPKSDFNNSYFDVGTLVVATGAALEYVYSGEMYAGEKMLSANVITTKLGAVFRVGAPDNTKAECAVSLEGKNAYVYFEAPRHVLIYNGNKTEGSTYALMNGESCKIAGFGFTAQNIKLWDKGSSSLGLRTNGSGWSVVSDQYHAWATSSVFGAYFFGALLSKNKKAGGSELLDEPVVEPVYPPTLSFYNDRNPADPVVGIKTLFNRSVLEINGATFTGGID